MPSRLAALLLVLLAATPALAQAPPQPRPAQPPTQAQPTQAQPPQVTIRNDGELILRELYIARAGQGRRDWGPDRFGDRVVPPGERFTLRLPQGFGCSIDIRLVFEDGEEELRERVDVCRVREQVFARAAPLPAADRELVVENLSPRTIQQLFVSPIDDRHWGDDRLGADTIPPGAGLVIRHPDQGCLYDLRVVFDTGAAEERRGVDLCALARLAVAPGWTTAEDPAAPAARPGPAVTAPAPVPVPLPAPASPGTVGILNNSGRTVLELFTYPDGALNQGPDRLGADVLRPGGSLRVPSARPPGCATTLRLVYDTGEAEVRPGLDFCTLAEIVIEPGGVAARPSRFASIVNAGTAPIVALHADAPGVARGPDRLGAAVIGVGRTFGLAPPEPGRCTYDLTARFRDGRTARIAGADLCAGDEIRIAP